MAKLLKSFTDLLLHYLPGKLLLQGNGIFQAKITYCFITLCNPLCTNNLEICFLYAYKKNPTELQNTARNL